MAQAAARPAPGTVPVRAAASPEELGATVADEVLAALRARPGRRYVLGLPSGRTAQPVVDALVAACLDEHLDVGGLRIVMMDDYVEPDGDGYRRVDPDLPHSCLGWALRGIVEPLAGLGMGAEQVVSPDPAAPERFVPQVQALGGVDLFVLASGQSDGHVALNPAGSPADATTRIVPLADTTRRDNLSTFPSFGGLDDVPRFGVTIGTGDFARVSRSVRMLLWGQDKRQAFTRITAVTSYEPDWPATIVHTCPDAVILADPAASGR